MASSNVEYLQYLASPEWAAKRQLVMVRALGRCEIVGCRNKAVDVHHWTYARIFREDLDDLCAICRVHHRQLHQHQQQRNRPAVTIVLPNRAMVEQQLDLFAANDNEPAAAPIQRNRRST